jgi:hemoglobin/transferrin/lactoferrin receptor protein
VQAGIRYTHYILNSDFSDNQPIFNLPFSESELNDGAVTGNLGINYSPTSTSTLRFNLSTGFRAPNVDDIGKVFDSEPGSVVIPNPDLRAEYAWNGELGFSKVISEKFKIDLAAYYTRLNNAMVRRNFQLNGQDSIIYDGNLSQVQAVQNAAESNVFGFQAGVEILLPWNLSITSNMNFQEGEEELDDGMVSPSRHAAPFFGTARINYRKGNLEIALYTNYSSERSFDDMPVEEVGKPHLYASDANGNPYAPGWYTLNIQGRYQLTDAIQISAGCENLTNQRFRPYSSGLAGPGLNGVFSISAKF